MYPYQKKFIRDNSVFRIVNKARQLGFSFVLAGEGIVEAMLDATAKILIVSSSEDAAKRVLTYCKHFYYSIPENLRPPLCKNSSTEMQFTVKDGPGGLLVSLPNNPRTVRGFNATRVDLDEAAHFRDDDEIFRALEPSIARGGKLTVVSTPNGRSNRFFEIWDKDTTYSKHRIPYTECPDEMYQRRILQFKKTMDSISFGQEFECNFHEDALAFFPEKILTPCKDENLQQHYELSPKGTVYLGIDWAKKHDSTAVIVGEHFHDGNRLVIKRIEEYKGMPYEAQLKRVFEICHYMKVDKIFCDSTGVGEKLFEDLTNRSGAFVEGLVFTINLKEFLISNLRILFENERISIPNNATLISQLRSLERSFTPAGNIRFEHVGGTHDDLVWALALCAYECRTHDVEIAYKIGKKSVADGLYTKEEHENMAKVGKLF
jgi:phage FluMu gp28-like protein